MESGEGQSLNQSYLVVSMLESGDRLKSKDNDLV